MAHAITTNLGQRHFNAALFTDNAAMFQTLVLAAQALVILDRAENFGTEQTIAFRLEGTVVNSFRLFNFAIGPGTDFLG